MRNIKQDIKSGFIRGVVFLVTILAGGIIYAAIGSTWTDPATLEVSVGSVLTASSWNKLLENFNNHENRINTLNTTVSNLPEVPQFLGLGQQTANLTVNDQTFTDIPGTSISFNLVSPKKVGMKAYGSVTPSGTTGPTHCGFRFVIDGIPYGNTSWGDQIIGCGNSTSIYGRWCNWNIERILDLSAGSHTVKLQMTGWSTSYPGCSSNINDYSKARLFVETKN